MKPSLLSVLVISLLAVSARAAEEGWRPLFNGKDFSGWELYLGIPNASAKLPDAERDEKGNFTRPLGVNNDPLHCAEVVEVDGRPAIHLGTEAPGGLATLESYGNYRLRLQYKWGAKKAGQRPEQARNAGVLYTAYGNHGDVKGRWLHSHQFQIQEGNTGDYIAMGDVVADLPAKKIDAKRFGYDPAAETIGFGNQAPATPNCAKAGDSYEKPAGEWNTLEIYVWGDSAMQVVNGHPALRLSKARTVEGKPLTSGRIELQMEGWEIYFRDIEITPISERPAMVSAP